MTKAPDIDRFIRELQNTLMAAELNFGIWWVYKDQNTRSKYIDSMNRYVDFFRVSIHAHFVANIIALYRLYERRPDSININNLIKIFPPEKISSLPPDFNDRLKRAKKIWGKICIIRNNCFAHLNGEQAVADLFKIAALKPDEMKQLMEFTKQILNDISQEWNGKVDAFDLPEARGDVIRLLDDLSTLSG